MDGKIFYLVVRATDTLFQSLEALAHGDAQFINSEVVLLLYL